MKYAPRRPARGYAEFTLPSDARGKIHLRQDDHLYEHGGTLQLLAPVHEEHDVSTLARRIEQQLGTKVEGKFTPKELKTVAGNLEINLRTGEAYLHTTGPLTADEIAHKLNELAQNDPCALAQVQALYVRTNETATYFITYETEGEINLLARHVKRDFNHIPLSSALTSGPVICPLRKGQEQCYYPTTKTLTIKTRNE